MIFRHTSVRRVVQLAAVATILFTCPLVTVAETSLPSARDLLADARTVEFTGL